MKKQETQAMILCCICGISMEANDANMCLKCLRSQVDITEGISKQLILFFCRGCGRYMKPPWIACALESRELLAICLKKIRGLRKDIKLIDAVFQWTEPHCKRIKVKVTVQKQVMRGAILQQSFIVEYVVQNQQCIPCQKSYTEHVWTSCVQIRQKVPHKRTMLFLEQMLLKHGICSDAMFVKEMPDGLDTYWANKNQASKQRDFVLKVVPCRAVDDSRKLISHDASSNVFNFKHSLYVEICPICKDDLVLIPSQLAKKLGGVSPLMLCYKVTNSLHMVDPVTLKLCDISANTYFRYPFQPVMNKNKLMRFVIMDIDYGRRGNPQNKNRHKMNDIMTLAEVECVKEDDFECNFLVSSHLGYSIKVGDTVLGYDFKNGCNMSGPHLRQIRKMQIPDIVLVKKTYHTKRNRARMRKFKLKRLEMEELDKRVLNKTELQQKENDMEDFLQEVEEDEHVRNRMNLYKKDGIQDMEINDSDDELPELTGLLDDTQISVVDPLRHTLDDNAPVTNTDPIDFLCKIITKKEQTKQQQ